MPPPPRIRDTAFHQQIDRAIALGEKAVDTRYNDASSHYELGAALGIQRSPTPGRSRGGVLGRCGWRVGLQ